ncbi:hypothetical protein HDF26_001728 [Pedobacter cryoconitis]|uniref:Uncharacterized protein n=1 Tax=Pedobacter cryoconitis TaxID=188932 RepID=A0A7W8ZMS9_9SPHI|nr:hypothetical protein [Pedobacter cryoconitis]MBB5636901.1 hypothetical protein [Pedobacter cryoconitis]MBB6271301.1 hypothetical protein [Pedobacter cryoconitis]
MKFTIIDPTDNMLLDLTALPEDYHGIQGWRIVFPENDSIVMAEKNQQWEVMEEPDISPDLINAIIKGLKPLIQYS